MPDRSETSRESSDEPATRVTILVDNDVRPGLGLCPEHGFSALIERGSERILFDTGQGVALPANAAALKIDLSGLSAVILSHGHYDHTGGLKHAVGLNPGVRIVAHPAVFAAHMKRKDGEAAAHTVGIPHTRRSLEDLGAVFKLTAAFGEVSPGIWFTGQVPRVFGDRENGRLIVVQGDSMIRDPLEDDVSLVIETGTGAVMLLGCAHAGLRNILEHVRVNLKVDRMYAVIGGTHLGSADRGETYAAIAALEKFDVRLVAAAHCTGAWPRELLKGYFGRRYCEAPAGAVFEF